TIELPKRSARSGYLSTNPMGGIWIVERKEGVTLYENRVMQNVPLPVHMWPTNIQGILADGDDPLMLATSAGLLRWNGQQWDALTEANGLPCNDLLGVVKDRAGSLWLPATCGLLEMETVELQEWRHNPARRPSFTMFDALDGAYPLGAGIPQPTMSLGPDGKVWYVTGVAIQMVDPGHIHKNLRPPPVHVEQVIADNRSFQPAGPLRLPPNPHTLEIDYTALSFSLPLKVLFRYVL